MEPEAGVILDAEFEPGAIVSAEFVPGAIVSAEVVLTVILDAVLVPCAVGGAMLSPGAIDRSPGASVKMIEKNILVAAATTALNIAFVSAQICVGHQMPVFGDRCLSWSVCLSVRESVRLVCACAL